MRIKRKTRPGFTLIELLIVCAIIAILAAIAVPNYSDAVTRSKVSAVKSDMRTMSTAVEAYMVDHNRYPIRRHRWQFAQAETSPTRWMMHHAPFVEKVWVREGQFFNLVGAVTPAIGLHVMTTPVPYLTTLPHDLFNLPAKDMANGAYFEFAWGGPVFIGCHGGSDHIDYYDPLQTDRWLNVVSNKPFSKGMAKGYMLISVGPDQYLGITNGPYSADLISRGALSFPRETPVTLNTEQYFYDPTNGTISTGNIYRFSGGLTQADLIPEIAGD